jgi:hypothetical protein
MGNKEIESTELKKNRTKIGWMILVNEFILLNKIRKRT